MLYCLQTLASQPGPPGPMVCIVFISYSRLFSRLLMHKKFVSKRTATGRLMYIACRALKFGQGECVRSCIHARKAEVGWSSWSRAARGFSQPTPTSWGFGERCTSSLSEVWDRAPAEIYISHLEVNACICR